MEQHIHLDLGQYLPFISLAEQQPLSLGLFNQFGRQFSLITNAEDQTTRQQLEQMILSTHWHGFSSEPQHIHKYSQGTVYFVELTLGAEEQKLWLIASVCTQQPNTQQQDQRYIALMAQITRCLCREYDNNLALVGMADELAVRYEELNLLYSMDDIESLYKTYNESRALRHLVKNCAEYMNLDYAAIYIKDQNFFFHQTAWSDAEQNIDLLEQVIRQQLFNQITSSSETLVVNINSAKDWTEVDINLPYKLIAAPIAKSNQRSSGMFVLINHPHKPDFTNSDRKLAEVLAAEASKLTQARRDPVTGQLNRRGILEQITQSLIEQNSSNRHHCFVFLDLDQFKVINDNVGQNGGDALLRQITAILMKNLKKHDVVGRIGPDEFGLILKNCLLAEAMQITERIRLVINQFRFLYQNKMFDLSACFSITDLSEQFDDYSQVLNAAELACQIAKGKGKNHCHVYSKTDLLTARHENQMQWISRINIAIEENRFQIYRQKIIGLQPETEGNQHYEILLRLKNEAGEILTPYHFIPAAERFNMMPKIDQWVIRQTFQTIARYMLANPNDKTLYSINLSGQTFAEDSMVNFIREQLLSNKIPSERICFEVTETAAISNLDQALSFIEEVKQLGCLFSLDDFGSGMSSFTYLKNIPVNYLKIDGYFVKTMLQNTIDQTMVNAIHQIGSVMGLKTIAEFVEDTETAEALRNMGIHYGQGFGIGLPELFE